MLFSHTLHRRRPARPVIFPDRSWRWGARTVIVPRPSVSGPESGGPPGCSQPRRAPLWSSARQGDEQHRKSYQRVEPHQGTDCRPHFCFTPLERLEAIAVMIFARRDGRRTPRCQGPCRQAFPSACAGKFARGRNYKEPGKSLVRPSERGRSFARNAIAASCEKSGLVGSIP